MNNLMLDDNFFDDPKIIDLEALGKMKVLLYIRLAVRAAQYNGVLAYSDNVLATIAGTGLTTIKAAIDSMVQVGLVEREEKGIFLPEIRYEIEDDKDEVKRQKIAERVKRWRQKKKDEGVTSSVTEALQERYIGVTSSVTSSVTSALQERYTGVTGALQEGKKEEDTPDKRKEAKENFPRQEERKGEYIQNAPAHVEPLSLVPGLEDPDMRSLKALKADFEEAWKAYPRKEGKVNAERDYIKARRDGISHQTIMAGIERYKAKIRSSATENQFILHGSTWFHQRRWTDEFLEDIRRQNYDQRQYDDDFYEEVYQ